MIDKLISNYYLTKYKFYSFLKGIKIIRNNNYFTLIKNNKKLIVKKKELTWRNPLTIKNNFDKIKVEYKNLNQAINLFDKLFSYSVSKTEIDLTKDFEINFFGKTITTDFEQFKEIEYGILWYNKHYKLKVGDVVFDLGGYHGLYSIFASSVVGPNGKIYCFEPDKDNLEILNKKY